MAGYVWRGLGIRKVSAPSPKGRRKAVWSLTHIGSGHRVGTLHGDAATAFPVATEIALAGDWTFDGLTGWKNQFPDVEERLGEIIARHSKVFTHTGSGQGNEDVARAIAMARTA